MAPPSEGCWKSELIAFWVLSMLDIVVSICYRTNRRWIWFFHRRFEPWWFWQESDTTTPIPPSRTGNINFSSFVVVRVALIHVGCTASSPICLQCLAWLVSATKMDSRFEVMQRSLMLFPRMKFVAGRSFFSDSFDVELLLAWHGGDLSYLQIFETTVRGGNRQHCQWLAPVRKWAVTLAIGYYPIFSWGHLWRTFWICNLSITESKFVLLKLLSNYFYYFFFLKLSLQLSIFCEYL